MEKFANAIMKHAKLIIVLWVVLLIVAASVIIIVNPNSVVKYEITDMKGASSESYDGMKILKNSDYFSSHSNDYVVVFTYDPNKAGEYDNLTDKYIPALEGKIQEHWSKDGTTTMNHMPLSGSNLEILSITLPEKATDKNAGVEWLRGTISDLKKDTSLGYSNTSYVTGNIAIGYDTQKAAMADVMMIDPFSVLLVLILIGLFFRSIISAATPPLTIGVAYAVVLMAVCFVGQITDIFYITTTLVLISMLGAGCDYCIFIIARYREERKLGKNPDDSLREAIMWAGESVAISGLCVIIGFGVMSLCSFSLVSTMGIILAVGIIFALLAALTLIPSIIKLVNDKIFWPTKVDDYMEGSKVCDGWYGKIGKLGQRYFRSSAKFSIKYAWVILVAAILITVPLTYVAVTEKTSFDMVSTMPNSESKQGIEAISACGAGGMTMPTEELLDLKNSELGKVVKITSPTDGKEYYALQWDTSEKAYVEILGDKIFLPAYLMASTWYMESIPLEELGTEISIKPEGIGKAILNKDDTKNISMMMGLMDWKSFVTYAQQMIKEETGKEISYSDLELRMAIVLGEKLGVDFSDVFVKFPGEKCIDQRSEIINYNVNVLALGSISQQGMTKTGDPLTLPNQYVKMTIYYKEQAMSDKSMDTAMNIRNACHDYQNNIVGKQFLIGTYTTGTTATLYDISEQVEGDFKIIEIAVIVLIILLLLFVMKSYLTPIRSVATIIMSVLWTLGMTHLVFGHALSMPILWLVPIVLFVVCLGLGMDYDVLLTTRIKEYVSKGMDNDTAIEQAVEHSGAIITICGLIMGGAFLTMVLSTTPMLQQFGFALGFAILVDALLIRTYVVPAVMHLLGKWNWVGPKFLQKKKPQTEE